MAIHDLDPGQIVYLSTGQREGAPAAGFAPGLKGTKFLGLT